MRTSRARWWRGCGVAKGLEPETGKRSLTEVYAEELAGIPIVTVGGPCLATELAEGLPTASVWAGAPLELATQAGRPFDGRTYQLTYTDDVIGVELCAMMKNVAAIGLGMLDGIGQPTGEDFKNAKAALFTKAAHEIVDLVSACGGRAETAFGLAGIGDQLVTSLGGRNRLYGELIGAGEPARRDPPRLGSPWPDGGGGRLDEGRGAVGRYPRARPAVPCGHPPGAVRWSRPSRHPGGPAMRQLPYRNLAMELVRVTESAALAPGARWMGRGDKNGADGAAVSASA